MTTSGLTSFSFWTIGRHVGGELVVSFVIDELDALLLGDVGADAVADRLAEGAVFPEQGDAYIADRLIQPPARSSHDEVDGHLTVFARRRADLECVLEAAAGDDLGGAGRLPMKHAVTLGRLAHRDRQRRGERTGRDLDALLGDEALGFADGGGGARRVAENIFDLSAVRSPPRSLIMSRAIFIASQFSIPFLANGPVRGSSTPMRIGAWACA